MKTFEDQNLLIENEISTLQRQLDIEILQNQDDIRALEDLRKRIVAVHEIIEQRLPGMIADKLASRFSPDLTQIDEQFLDTWRNFLVDIEDFTKDLTFLKILDFAKYSRAVQGEMYAKFKDVNTLRNKFSHTKDGQYKNFIDRKHQRDALQTLCLAMNFLNKYIYYFETVEEHLKKKNADKDTEIPF